MADIREQDLALKTTISDTDWIRLVTPTGNHRMTVGQFKDLIGYTQLQTDVSALKNDVADYVVEQGTNYTKWASGKLECRGNFIATNGTTQAQGGIFRSETVQTVTFPIPFVSAPKVYPTTQSFQSFGIMINSIAYNTFNFRLLHYVSQNLDTECAYEAEGRWK